jgi:hypothetical protein
MQNAISHLKDAFGSRLLYVGLQGSYLRGEANENSDIDVAVIIDGLSVKDLALYKEIIQKLDDPEKACGFVCGKDELRNWNPLEICGFLHGTKDYYGSLCELLPTYTSEDVADFIKLSVGNLYHELVHRYLHTDTEKNKRALPYSYKGVFFILQSVYYLKTGVFYQTRRELTEHLSGIDRDVMQRAARLADGAAFELDQELSFLLEWCKVTLREF